MLPLLIVLLAQVLPIIPYEDAVRLSEASEGRTPLVIFVQSEDCPPCKTMARETIEPMVTDGEFRSVIFTQTADRRRLGELGVTSTPALVGYVQRDGQWKRYRMQGKQSRDRVREFLGKLR